MPAAKIFFAVKNFVKFFRLDSHVQNFNFFRAAEFQKFFRDAGNQRVPFAIVLATKNRVAWKFFPEKFRLVRKFFADKFDEFDGLRGLENFGVEALFVKIFQNAFVFSLDAADKFSARAVEQMERVKFAVRVENFCRDGAPIVDCDCQREVVQNFFAANKIFSVDFKTATQKFFGIPHFKFLAQN